MRSDAAPTLRRELTRLATWIGIGWLLALSVAVAWTVKQKVDELLDETLREAAEVMFGVMVTARLPVREPAEQPEVLPAPSHDERLVWQIVDGGARLARRSHKAPQQALSPAPRTGFFDAPGPWRVYGMQLPGERHWLYVAQTGRDRIESRLEVVASVALVTTVVNLLWIWLLRRRLRRAMLPLERLAQQIEAYDPEQAHSEPRPGHHAETQGISAAVVSLGRRLARRIESERAFAACAAHSLRTPLAGMDAQLALAQREPAAMQPLRLTRVREAVSRLTRGVESLLALFRAGAEKTLEHRHCGLQELVEQIPVSGVEVTVRAQGTFVADPNLLAIALANLLDNASRFEARRVQVSLAAFGKGVAIRLEDDGRGVSVERWREIRRVLHEGDVGPGAGLGLRLASMVAKAHGGRLWLPEPAPDQVGFVVELRLWTTVAAA